MDRTQIANALYEARHYQELAQEAYEDGDLESAAGWLRAIGEEVATALGESEAA
jgi:hypothetical protein